MSSVRNAGALLWGILSLAASTEAQAGPIGSGHNFGLGVSLGYPATGITGKYYLGSTGAIEGVVGTWADDGWGDGWYLHCTYQYHPSIVTSGPGWDLPWHVGIGGFLGEDYRGWWGNDWDDDLGVGARGVIGLEFDLHDPRLQFTGDLGLNLLVVPEVEPDLSLSIAIRYYF